MMRNIINDMRPAFRALDNKMPGEMFSDLKTPCYIIDEKRLDENCKVLSGIMKNTGCRILLAQKAFSCYDFYPLISKYLSGTEASGLYEARLGAEEMSGGEVHVFCAAYREDEIDGIIKYADHIVFNSPSQLRMFGGRAKRCGKSVGLRINPEYSTQEGHEIYDPCAPGSRLGITREIWDTEMTDDMKNMIDGLHFHTLCEQNSDALEATFMAVEDKFGDILPKMKWINMGGGHHITREDYDILRLEKVICHAGRKWGAHIYLEPGEAVALNAGYLVSRVLDITSNKGVRIAILDASAACHMPDVIEMPYMPPLYQSACQPGKAKYTFRLTGPTCLAGDVIGDYGFDDMLQCGDMLVFGDMAIYSICKNNTFNGMSLPNVWKRSADGTLERLTCFGYDDFKMRLGSRKNGNRISI